MSSYVPSPPSPPSQFICSIQQPVVLCLPSGLLSVQCRKKAPKPLLVLEDQQLDPEARSDLVWSLLAKVWVALCSLVRAPTLLCCLWGMLAAMGVLSMSPVNLLTVAKWSLSVFIYLLKYFNYLLICLFCFWRQSFTTWLEIVYKEMLLLIILSPGVEFVQESQYGY